IFATFGLFIHIDLQIKKMQGKQPSTKKKVELIIPPLSQLKTARASLSWGSSAMPDINMKAANPKLYKDSCKKALPYFNQAISLDYGLTVAHEYKGRSLICQGRKEAALQSLYRMKELYIKHNNQIELKDFDDRVNDILKKYQ
ncbi:MAG: hypothetical protein AAF378_23930, partial [Cyanobacteria bacterium P01_A01_bin.84]